MGGHAYKDINTVRLNAEQYHPFSEVTVNALSTHFPHIDFIIIPSFRHKSDFGDLDILFSGGHLDYVGVEKVLHSPSSIRNGPVTSYAALTEEGFFQIDLIRVPEECFEFAYGYFSYNDLGNLLGRIYHRMGLKFGHLGLRCLIRDEENSSHVIEEIILTRNFRRALEFAGYDYRRWQQGFDTLEDVFRYAVSIPLANRVIFRLDETNHQARVRDKKRNTYNQFLSWVNNPENGVPETEVIEKSELRSYFLEKAFILFPEFRGKYSNAQEYCKKLRLAKEKFNGLIVHHLTGLTGRELGSFMNEFIRYVTIGGKIDRTDWILSTPHVSNEIMDFYWGDFTKWVQQRTRGNI